MADFLGKYELRHVLGKGAMGTVYEGFDPVIARRVAIKTVRLPAADDHEAQEELARFKREAQAAGRLSHPNIVGVFDYGETPELAYIVMEFVDGTTLKHVVDKGERFELAEIARIMEALMAGLQFSHDRGVVHRDIKPANVMLTQQGEVKIADFGIARIESSSMTQAGTMLGTPSYMSPEQFMGQTVDNRTDLYSSGVMLYQLLTGEKPFEGGLTAIMHKVLNTEPPLPSVISVTVPHAFDAVVRKAMAKRPEDRFASANAFAAAVREALSAKAPVAQNGGFGGFDDGDATMVAPAKRPSALPQPAPAVISPPATALPKKGPNFALFGGIGVAVLLLAAGGGYFLLRGALPPTPAPGASKPAVVPPVAPPAPQMTDAQRDKMLADLAANAPCSLLTIAGIDTLAPVITGLLGGGEPQQYVSQRLAAIPGADFSPVNNAQTINGPYCAALNDVRPYHDFTGNPAKLLSLGLAGGKTTLQDGDLITIDQTVPGFTRYIETDYYSSDGSVYHLTPTLNPGQSSLSQPIGNVSAPYGTDMIISIASSAPLFADKRLQDEGIAPYLTALLPALSALVSGGGQVSVAATALTTVPK